nr:DUF5710 domain-containing protein [Burkholderia plantarii]
MPLPSPNGAGSRYSGRRAAFGPAGTEAQGEAQKPAQQAQQARQYLAVPYEQRNAAKAAGALWDKAAKSWYVGPRADAAKLERWKPEERAGPARASDDAKEEFAEAMRSAGLFTGSNAQGDHPIMDGKRTACRSRAARRRARWLLRGPPGRAPGGRIINNKTGTDITWKSKGYALSDQEKAKLQAEAAEKLAQRAVEQDKARRPPRSASVGRWPTSCHRAADALPASQRHPGAGRRDDRPRRPEDLHPGLRRRGQAMDDAIHPGGRH